MKKAFKLTVSMMVVLVMLCSCGGGGGGGVVTQAENNNTTDGNNTTGDNNTTDNNAVLIGGCALMTDTLFDGQCVDYFADHDVEFVTPSIKSACENGGSVFYADGCPPTIGSSTRLGKCTTGEGGTKLAFAWYSPEKNYSDRESLCALMEGTWVSD